MKLTRYLAVAAVLAAFGCSPPPIVDRTNPNYVKKSDLLQGQWYIQTSVVDVPATPTGSVKLSLRSSGSVALLSTTPGPGGAGSRL